MDSSPPRSKTLLAAILMVVFLGCLVAPIIRSLGRNTAALEELRRECAQLRADLEARDRSIESLQSKLENLLTPGTAPRTGLAPVPAPTARDGDIDSLRRVAELAALQSNVAALIERLQMKSSGPEPPEQAARRAQAGVTLLETTVQNHQQKLEAARQKTAGLLLDLNIPPEVSTLDAAKGLDTASLRAYWPYFEAKRERETMQSLAERLAMRLLQEKIDASIEAARGNAP
jgi:DNA repair exonuclease SbcCD ATPase subunit